MIRPKRFPLKLNTTRKRVSSKSRFSFLERLESTLLRVMILGTILLAVFQFNTITDPVDFYLKIASDLDSPAFKYDEYLAEDNNRKDKLISLDFQAEPVSSVLVKQNNEVIGEIGNGVKLQVEPGTVTLDATQVRHPVTVYVILNQKSHMIELNQDAKSFNIKFNNENK